MDSIDREWLLITLQAHHERTEERLLEQLGRIERQIMAALDDLNASIGNLNTAVTGAVDKINSGNQDPGITAAAQAVQAAADALNAAVTPQTPA